MNIAGACERHSSILESHFATTQDLAPNRTRMQRMKIASRDERRDVRIRLPLSGTSLTRRARSG